MGDGCLLRVRRAHRAVVAGEAPQKVAELVLAAMPAGVPLGNDSDQRECFDWGYVGSFGYPRGCD